MNRSTENERERERERDRERVPETGREGESIPVVTSGIVEPSDTDPDGVEREGGDDSDMVSRGVVKNL